MHSLFAAVVVVAFVDVVVVVVANFTATVYRWLPINSIETILQLDGLRSISSERIWGEMNRIAILFLNLFLKAISLVGDIAVYYRIGH